MSNDKLFEIKNKIKNSERIVFKFGTNVLRNDDKDISLSRIYSFIEDVASLKKQGKEVIIVTSGAVGLGAKRLGVDSNESMSVKQACAAVGQSRLMSVYEDGFEKYGYTIAQILLTEEDFTQRIKYLFLHHSNQRLQLLRGKAFKFFHDVCIIIQLQEPRVELHLLGKRKSINVAVSDIAVYRVTHTLRHIVMRDSDMSEVCCLQETDLIVHSYLS